MIKFLDLKAVNERFRAEMDAAAKRVLDATWRLLVCGRGESREWERAYFGKKPECLI